MKLHTSFRTALGARNLALNLDAPRFRHLDQAVRDFLLYAAAALIFICALPFVSHWLREVML